MKRTKIKITYHGRSGRPIIHRTKNNRKYIMVRAKDGRGVKRLYEGSKYYSENGVIKRLKL